MQHYSRGSGGDREGGEERRIKEPFIITSPSQPYYLGQPEQLQVI
jgi:hypothetical protein